MLWISHLLVLCGKVCRPFYRRYFILPRYSSQSSSRVAPQAQSDFATLTQELPQSESRAPPPRAQARARKLSKLSGRTCSQAIFRPHNQTRHDPARCPASTGANTPPPSSSRRLLRTAEGQSDLASLRSAPPGPAVRQSLVHSASVRHTSTELAAVPAGFQLPLGQHHRPLAARSGRLRQRDCLSRSQHSGPQLHRPLCVRFGKRDTV